MVEVGWTRTVVGPVLRLKSALVVCGRTLVPNSFAPDFEPSWAVPASLPLGEESGTRGVPSIRQKTRASSFSKRLHWGQRFMVYLCPMCFRDSCKCNFSLTPGLGLKARKDFFDKPLQR